MELERGIARELLGKAWNCCLTGKVAWLFIGLSEKEAYEESRDELDGGE